MNTDRKPVVALPVVEVVSSLRGDGQRNYVHPADVSGRFTTLRQWVFVLLLGIYFALPWIPIGGHPAVFIDMQHRRFYLFGNTFNAQDFWLVFFLVTGIGFALIVVTTMWGRVWCGYACPQTVFLEGLFRRVERWIEGPRNIRMRRNEGPWNFDKIWRKFLKQLIFIALALLLAHVFLSYFVSLPAVFEMVRKRPALHPEAFAWTFAMTGIFYFNFAWFREQLCVIICPYGRLQSVMTDQDTIVIGYDAKRGEPRGRAHDPSVGDCVACNRCVVVCPTGIDIRNGLQLDCIGCAACIDACDEVMHKLGRKPGLVRYDSLNHFAGVAGRFWRPRLALYAVLGVIGLSVLSFALTQRSPYEANVVRMIGAPYVVTGDTVRNGYEVHLINKQNQSRTFRVVPIRVEPGMQYNLTAQTITLKSMGSRRVPLAVVVPLSSLHRRMRIRLRIEVSEDAKQNRLLEAPFLGPGV